MSEPSVSFHRAPDNSTPAGPPPTQFQCVPGHQGGQPALDSPFPPQEVFDGFDLEDGLIVSGNGPVRHQAPDIEGCDVVGKSIPGHEGQLTLTGMDPHHLVLDETSAPVKDGFSGVKADLPRPIIPREHAGRHPGIVMIGIRTDDGDPMSSGDDIPDVG